MGLVQRRCNKSSLDNLGRFIIRLGFQLVPTLTTPSPAMKTIKSFFSFARQQDKPPANDSASDTLMLDIDFLDQKGHWNPKVVLFSKQTARERSESLLVKLFGGIMKLQARRWAENYFRGVLQREGVNSEKNHREIKEFLKNIKAKGKVDRREFYHLATVTMLRELGSPSLKDQLNEKRLLKYFQPGPAFLNRDEVIRNTLAEMLKESTEGRTHENYFGNIPIDALNTWIADHVGDQEKAVLISQLHRLNPPTKNPHPQTLQPTQDDQPPTQDNKPPAADKPMNTPLETTRQSSKPHEKSASSAEDAATNTPTKPAPEIALESSNAFEKSQPPAEKKAHEIILQKYKDILDVRGGQYAHPLYREAHNSGFLDYCINGLVSPTVEKMDTLYNFISRYQNDFHNYKNILSESQYEELIDQAKKLIDDIRVAREWIEKSNNTSLFDDIEALTGDDLSATHWNIKTLLNKLQIKDLEKIDIFFARAECNESHLDLANKLRLVAKSMHAQLFANDTMREERRAFFVEASNHLYELASAFIAKMNASTDADAKKYDLWLQALVKNGQSALSGQMKRKKESAHIILIRRFFDLNQIRNETNRIPPALEHLTDSGFLSYCLYGYRHLSSMNVESLDRLERMASDKKKIWPDLKDFLTSDGLSEIHARRETLILDIRKSRLDTDHQKNRARMTLDDDPPDTKQTKNRQKKIPPSDLPPKHLEADSSPENQSQNSFNQSMRDQIAEANALIARLTKKQ